MATEIDIAVTTTTYDVTIVAEPNEYIVNITTGGGGGGTQTLAQTLVLGNTTGGTNILVNDADAIELENTSLLKKGTYDFGGDGGISRICSNQYEDMWQSGFRHVFDQSGFIRHSTNCFDVVPDSSFDNTLRFKVDSLWTLDSGITYKCTDASTGAAVWEIYNNFIPNLTQVLTVGDKVFDAVSSDRTWQPADRLKYWQVQAGIQTLDDSTDIFPINSLIEGVIQNDDINATVTFDFSLTSPFYLNETITTLTLNVGDFFQLKKASLGGIWILSVWNKSSGGGGVPYTGATQDVDLGAFDLYTSKQWLYDAPNDNYGSLHYTDGNFHIEDGDGHPLLVLEDEFMQIHKSATIQSNLWTSLLSAIRDHYLPNESGTLALTSIVSNTITDGVTDKAPSQNAVFDALQFTRKLITNGTGSVTGTTSETILTSLTIPANTLDSKCFIWSTMDYFKTNSGSCTLRLYVNSANSLSGATLLGFIVLGSNRNVSFNRKLYLSGTSLDLLTSSASSQVSNEFIELLFAASTVLTVNPANDIFLIYTTQNDVVGTVATSKQATVQKMKLN
jgi:hypothetical protein